MDEKTLNEQDNKRFGLTYKDSVFKLLFCISSVILSFFGIYGGFRGGFTVSALILFASMTAYFINKKTVLSIYPLICGILNCGLATVFTVTSNGKIRLLSVFSMILLSAVWFLSLVKKPAKEGDFALIAGITVPIIRGCTVNLPKALAAIFSTGSKKGKGFGKVILGILLAVPVLIIVVPLLMLSDAAFAGLIGKVSENLFITVFKVLLGLFISVFLISYCFTVRKNELPKAKALGLCCIDNTVVISFLSVLSFCYLMYLFSQLAYFFSAFKGILPEDYTFTMAGYARRGFFEMCIIAIINFVIIFAVLILSQRKSGKICALSRTLCTFVGFFTLMIIATALSKMFLYIKSYGMTELRITTSSFMVFLAIVFISVMLKVFIPEIRVLKAAIVTAACVLLALGTVNINRVIADYNYNAYKSGILKEIDIETISELGDEGIPYLVKLTSNKDKTVADSAERAIGRIIIIEKKYYEYECHERADNYDGTSCVMEYEVKDKKYNGIGKYSIARDNAYKALDKYLEHKNFKIKFDEI